MRFFEMNNIFVYIEMEGGKVADVSLELLTKGRELATTLGVKREAVVLGEHLAGIETELAKYGADTVWVADDKIFAPFRTLPHTAVMCGLIEQEKPQIVLFGATCNGRDFAPRVSSALYSGLTADCTQLVIGDHKDAKTGKTHRIYLPVELRQRLLQQAGTIWVFEGRSDARKHRTRGAVYKDMTQAAAIYRRSGMTDVQHISPHSARKVATVRAYKKGGLDAAQAMLVHDPDHPLVTMIYALSDQMPPSSRRRSKRSCAKSTRSPQRGQL